MPTPNPNPADTLRWTIDALYERELRAEAENPSENGYQIGANLRLSGAATQVKLLKNQSTEADFIRLNQVQAGAALGSLFKDMVKTQVSLDDERKRKMKTIMVLQVLKAAMDARPSSDSKKLDILSFGTSGGTAVQPAYEQAMPAIFGNAALAAPGIMSSLLGQQSQDQGNSFHWFEAFVKELFPLECESIIAKIKEIYAPLVAAEIQPGQKDEIVKQIKQNKEAGRVELFSIVQSFLATQRASLSSLPVSDVTSSQAPGPAQESSKQSFWPNWLVRLAKFFSIGSKDEHVAKPQSSAEPGLLARWFPRVFGEKQQPSEAFNNPAYGLEDESQKRASLVDGPATVFNSVFTTSEPSASPPTAHLAAYSGRTPKAVERTIDLSQAIALRIERGEEHPYTGAIEAIKKLADNSNCSNEGILYKLDVSKLPLDDKALMRLMHLYNEIENQTLPKNITVIGLKDRCEAVKAMLVGKNFEASTLRAYAKQTWRAGPERAFRDALSDLEAVIQSPPKPRA